MIIFKQNEKIAFDGINIEYFEAGIGYDLSAEKVEILKGFNINFVIADDVQIDLTEQEKAEAIDVAEVIAEVAAENEVAAKIEIVKKRK